METRAGAPEHPPRLTPFYLSHPTPSICFSHASASLTFCPPLPQPEDQEVGGRGQVSRACCPGLRLHTLCPPTGGSPTPSSPALSGPRCLHTGMGASPWGAKTHPCPRGVR